MHPSVISTLFSPKESMTAPSTPTSPTSFTMMATFLPALLSSVPILTSKVVFPLPKKPASWQIIIIKFRGSSNRYNSSARK